MTTSSAHAVANTVAKDGGEVCGKRTPVMAGRAVRCPRCSGDGIVYEPFTQICPRCELRGFVLVHLRSVGRAVGRAS